MHEAVLQRVVELFAREALTPVVGAELEFYLHGDVPKTFFTECYTRFGEAGILTHAITPEKTAGQYEISLVHLPDAVVMAGNVVRVKKIIAAEAEARGLEADFRAKPFADKPGSGLHIHVHVQDAAGKNLFAKEGGEESEAMRWAIGGLCTLMPANMQLFAPKEECYARYTAVRNDAEAYAHNDAPVNVSWGGNNRSTAIRIPTSTALPEGRHIEHRVGCSDADPYEVIAAVLAGVHYGITQQVTPPERIYGNAWEKQYDLPALPKSLKEAEAVFKESAIMQEYFEGAKC